MSTVLIVGSGRMAAIRANAIKTWDPGARMVFSTRDSDRAHQLARRFGGSSVQYAEIGTVACDAVMITSATAHHREDLLNAFPLGVPILMEKPVAHSAAASQELLGLAQQAGVPVVIGFQRRFDREFRELHDTVREGRIGKLYLMRSASMDHTPQTEEFIASSAGIFRDLFVHDFDLGMWITGQAFVSVYAAGACRVSDAFARHGDFDLATVVGTLENGVQVTMEGLRHSPYGSDVRWELYGSQDVVAAGLTRSIPVRSVAEPSMTCNNTANSFEDRFADAFIRETTSFMESCTKDLPFEGCSLREAVAASVVAEACELSVREGGPVPVATDFD